MDASSVFPVNPPRKENPGREATKLLNPAAAPAPARSAAFLSTVFKAIPVASETASTTPVAAAIAAPQGPI